MSSSKTLRSSLHGMIILLLTTKHKTMTSQQKLLLALQKRAAGKPKVKAKIKKIKQKKVLYDWLAM